MTHYTETRPFKLGVRRILKAAKKLLLRRGGWGQGGGYGPKNRNGVPKWTDAGSALVAADGIVKRLSHSRNLIVEDALGRLQSALWTFHEGRIYHWNDMPHRKRKDVIELYDLAIGVINRELRK